MMCASFGAHAGVDPPPPVDVDAVGLELDHADVGQALAQGEQRRS